MCAEMGYGGDGMGLLALSISSNAINFGGVGVGGGVCFGKAFGLVVEAFKSDVLIPGTLLF